MSVIIFGTVIRTRASMGRLLRQAVAQGKADTKIFEWGLAIYNSGIFGLVIYRTWQRDVGKDFFTSTK